MVLLQIAFSATLVIVASVQILGRLFNGVHFELAKSQLNFKDTFIILSYGVKLMSLAFIL